MIWGGFVKVNLELDTTLCLRRFCEFSNVVDGLSHRAHVNGVGKVLSYWPNVSCPVIYCCLTSTRPLPHQIHCDHLLGSLPISSLLVRSRSLVATILVPENSYHFHFCDLQHYLMAQPSLNRGNNAWRCCFHSQGQGLGVW